MRRLLTALTALILSACASASAPADGRATADLIVTGGHVLTMAGPEIRDGAVVIRDGGIVAVGPRSEIEGSWKSTDRIDAPRGAVLPGLINAHTHVPMTLFRGIADDRALMDWLQNFIFPAEAKNVDRDFVIWGTRLAAAEMIRSGTTTFVDMYYYEADIAAETRKAGLRAILGETVLDFPAPDNKTWDAAIDYLRDFVQQYRGDSLVTPALAPHAPYTVSREHLQQIRALASEWNVPILIHLAETQDEMRQIREREGQSPTQYLETIGFLKPDVIAAHAVHVDAADIAVLRRHGVGVVHNPESNMMLASGVSPVVELRQGGVAVGLGTDGPAGSNNDLDMFGAMAAAARLQKISRMDPQAVSAEDVLRMATIDGARALDLDSKIGSLERGKRADLIVVDLDSPGIQPVYSVPSALVYAASGSDVTHTIVDGKVLMRDRKVLTVDVPAVVARAKEIRDKVLASLATNE